MYNLDIKKEVIPYVRYNLDEQGLNDSDMLDMDDIDSNELDNLIYKLLPEAINAIHSSAPVTMLDGIIPDENKDEVRYFQNGGYTMEIDVFDDILRLVKFKAIDSNYIVTELTPEASTRGLMQLNPYTESTFDNPCLVIKQGKYAIDESGEKKEYTMLVYHSFATPQTGDGGFMVESFQYLPLYRYVDSTESYDVADNVVEAILDRLTALVLATYGSEKASYFMEKSTFK